MDAAQHFEWARERAMEYVAIGDGAGAMSSLITDLNNHPGTKNIITPDLQTLFMGEVLLGGAEGARRFINGIPVPYVDAES